MTEALAEKLRITADVLAICARVRDPKPQKAAHTGYLRKKIRSSFRQELMLHFFCRRNKCSGKSIAAE
jgi:hypothetical protein